MSNQLRLAKVEWADSRQPSAGWQFIEDLEPSSCDCVSVGYIVRDDVEFLALAQNIADIKKDSPQCSGVIVIPKRAIKTVADLSAGHQG